MNNKTIIEFSFHIRHLKNYGDLGRCYPPWPIASSDNTLLNLYKSSDDMKAEFNNNRYLQTKGHCIHRVHTHLESP